MRLTKRETENSEKVSKNLLTDFKKDKRVAKKG